ncbi:hypothetical protein ACSW9V_15205 (plasmid) [Clostridium perfringens]|uniref:hypothetical protein n=1 Tax=Clostridium perfringens TaxID=1502 RepID=UPI000B371FB7|nr:hypothetical protein [Clostridium perfringens]EGT0690045.1 hypothetical protein [Clostridium perfringens]EGT0693565.1 hypothetical protein [Clostridium perfringens]EGT0696834.1 hypothetical protein [Clostridium perfringens]MDU3376230.1 hypothetical protein [Clostridium perfringens]MDU3534186.1 hypothetical protein [Clostridium perfringens]
MYKFLVSKELNLGLNEEKFKKQFVGEDYSKFKPKFESLELNLEVFQEITMDDLDKLLIKELNKLSFIEGNGQEDSIFNHISFEECIKERHILFLLTYSTVLSIRFDIVSDEWTDSKDLRIKIRTIFVF